jgi:chlorophyllase
MALAIDRENEIITAAALSLFNVGKLNVTILTKKSGSDASLVEIMISSPIDAGVYPVILFIHGFFLQNHYYTQLLRHISSHGYIVIVPKVCFVDFFFLYIIDDMTLC